jgi:hypothetical protein
MHSATQHERMQAGPEQLPIFLSVVAALTAVAVLVA